MSIIPTLRPSFQNLIFWNSLKLENTDISFSLIYLSQNMKFNPDSPFLLLNNTSYICLDHRNLAFSNVRGRASERLVTAMLEDSFSWDKPDYSSRSSVCQLEWKRNLGSFLGGNSFLSVKAAVWLSQKAWTALSIRHMRWDFSLSSFSRGEDYPKSWSIRWGQEVPYI